MKYVVEYLIQAPNTMLGRVIPPLWEYYGETDNVREVDTLIAEAKAAHPGKRVRYYGKPYRKDLDD